MSANGRDADSRPVLVPAGNKTSLTPPKLKPGKKPEKKDDKLDASPKTPALTARAVLKRKETLLHSNLSLNASCSSDCSTESFRSRASTGRIRGRGSLSGRRRQGVPRPEWSVERVVVDGAVDGFGKKRCAWVTPNTDPGYSTFHDEEWGVPVHDDKKLFELLVLSGALAELTWPVILSKREMFREVFLDFDPVAVSKLNEKKFVTQGSTASSLLSEPKLRAAIENARQIFKIVEEFGSLDKYFWNFVNHKPIINRFRYSRQVPVKTPKADFISKDMVRRGFRSVGPTVIYSFMQASGMTNDHLISCYRFEECCVAVSSGGGKKEESNQANGKMEDDSSLGTSDTTITTEQEHRNIDLELARAVEDLSIS